MDSCLPRSRHALPKQKNSIFATDKLTTGLNEIGGGIMALTTAQGIGAAGADMAHGAEKILGSIMNFKTSKEAVVNARAKFRELDKDDSGTLEGDELVALAEWIWSSFHPEGVACSAEEKAAMVEKLLHRLDENEDGRLSFSEFEEYFERTAEAMKRYRHRAAPRQRIKPQARIVSRPEVVAAAEINGRAMKKFRELDVDGSGALEGAELVQLAEWVWSSFHPDGQVMGDAEKEAFVEKLLYRIDENQDGKLTADEFQEYFIKTTKAINNFRRRPSQVAAARARRAQAARQADILKHVDRRHLMVFVGAAIATAAVAVVILRGKPPK